MPRPRRLRTDAVQSSLDTYFSEIDQTPLLTAEQERELAYRIETGDAEARDRMVRANLRLVVNIARSYVAKGLSLSDLIEEGNLGLMRAVEGFDPAMNTRFSTYASYWIKQAIRRALVNTAKTIRLPVHMVELLAKWHRAAGQLQDELGRVPTPEEIARRIGLPKKKLASIQRAIHVSNSVLQTDQGESGWSIDELLMDGSVKPPETELVASEARQQVAELLGLMDPREVAVLQMRFGLGDKDPKTFQEIGDCLGLTRERVRQIESEALHKLSQRLQAKQGKKKR